MQYENVVVGDVWLCGGQSNMEDVLEGIYHGDVEVASANHPLIRLMTIPAKATPDEQVDFERLNEFNSWTGRHHERFIPVPSFRTDDWGWDDAPFGPEERGITSRRWHEARQAAEAQMKKRKLKEAEARLNELKGQA